MKGLNEYINESLINEGFKDFLKNIYDVVTGKKRAEEKRIKEEEFAQRKKDLEAWRDKFFDVVKNGTKKNDLLVVHYKYSDFSKKYCGSFDKYKDYTCYLLCDNNTLKNAEDSYEMTEYWGYLNATDDEEKIKNGFKILMSPIFEDEKLSARSFKTGDRNRAELIYLFDCEDIRLNDPKDIDNMIDILNGPRDFVGGNIEGIIDELKSKRK